MKQTRIANRYAKALFDLSLEQGLLDEVKNDMELVKSVCVQNKDFQLLLRSPIIFSHKKEAILKAIFESKIQQISYYFLLIITRKSREAFIEAIATQFMEQYKKYKNIITVCLSTAVKLDEKLKNKLVELLKEQTKAEIDLVEEIKEELIGGFVLSYEDKQYDASIRKHIAKLSKDFDANLYIREF